MQTPACAMLRVAPGSIILTPGLGPDRAGWPDFIYLADSTSEVAPEVRTWLDGQPREGLRVALRTSEKVLGLISVDNLISGRPITPEDAPPLVAFANAFAAAVENIILLEERE